MLIISNLHSNLQRRENRREEGAAAAEKGLQSWYSFISRMGEGADGNEGSNQKFQAPDIHLLLLLAQVQSVDDWVHQITASHSASFRVMQTHALTSHLLLLCVCVCVCVCE